MSVALDLLRFIDYSDHERAKWREWFAAKPERLAIPFQPGGRFPTVGSLLEHVFFVERRHLSRLEGATPPDASGVSSGDAEALFEYAELVRADFRHWEDELTPAVADGILTWVGVGDETYTMSRRKLAIHILMHEVRHLAQLAYAARLAGQEPPGRHDYFYFPES